MELFIWTGFSIGILGSFHCLGMCGPLALAIPHISISKSGIIADGIIYNLGRAITYSLMGLILGLLGVSIKLAGFQDYLSIILGILMVSYLFIPKKYISILSGKTEVSSLIGRIKQQFKSLLFKKNRFTLLLIGILNGFLPCGLVYIALAGSLAAADTLYSTLYMFAFGIGTIPMLVIVYSTKNLLTASMRVKINKLIPYVVAFVGILLILRGLNLGIPYISPILPETVVSEGGSCCH